jgi:hypothetical protein
MSTSTDCIGDRSTTRPVVAGRVAGDVVGAAADSNPKPGVGSEVQGSCHVHGAHAPYDHGRSTVDHAVPDPSCDVVIMMPAHDHLTGDLTGEPAGVDARHGGHLPTVDAARGCQPAIRTFSPAPGGARNVKLSFGGSIHDQTELQEDA